MNQILLACCAANIYQTPNVYFLASRHIINMCTSFTSLEYLMYPVWYNQCLSILLIVSQWKLSYKSSPCHAGLYSCELFESLNCSCELSFHPAGNACNPAAANKYTTQLSLTPAQTCGLYTSQTFMSWGGSIDGQKINCCRCWKSQI